MNVEMLIAPHVRGMQPYVPIVPLDVLSRRLGLPADRIVKLDANENPYGTSPRALEALAHSRELHIYPDPDQTALREALAAFIGVPMEHILCGAGGDEVIDLLLGERHHPRDDPQSPLRIGEFERTHQHARVVRLDQNVSSLQVHSTSLSSQ